MEQHELNLIQNNYKVHKENMQYDNSKANNLITKLAYLFTAKVYMQTIA